MTKSDVFVSVGYMDRTDPRKYSPMRRYFLRLHDKDLNEIMKYLGKKAIKFDPVREASY